MQAQEKYTSEIVTVPMGDRMITIENLTPILTPKERDKRKKEIERRIYTVFSKYAKMRGTPA